MIVGILHLLAGIFLFIYSFTKSIKYDRTIFYILLFIGAHFILLDGECVISYAYKKWKNPNYVLGTTIDELEDVQDTYQTVREKTGVDISWISNLHIFLVAYITFCLRMCILRSVPPTWAPYALCVFMVVCWNLSFHMKEFNKDQGHLLKLVTFISAITIAYAVKTQKSY